jgi:hypothetical protein
MRNLLALLALCTMVVACDTRSPSSVTAAPFSAELGTYALQTVSGTVLPYPLPPNAPNTTRQVTADTLVLTSGGNVREIYYVATTTTTTPPSTPSIGTVALSGKYTITRDSVHLPTDFQFTYGRYTSNTLTMYDPQGYVYVFLRR